MDKNEIIERLERLAGCAIHTVGELPFVMSLDDGIAIHEAIDMLRSRPEPHWILCSKELPKIGDRVIGTYKNSLFENGPYVVRVMHREKKYWVGDDEHWFLYKNIIAWMPLPEPYRAERRTDG